MYNTPDHVEQAVSATLFRLRLINRPSLDQNVTINPTIQFELKALRANRSEWLG